MARPLPDPLTDRQRQELRDQLQAERRRVATQLTHLEQTFDELVDAADLEPPDDEHDPDGTTAYERAQVSSLAHAARAQLTDLDLSLAAAGDAAFGRCVTCEQPIGFERLQAVPGTSHCVGCAATR